MEDLTIYSPQQCGGVMIPNKLRDQLREPTEIFPRRCHDMKAAGCWEFDVGMDIL